MPQRGIRSGSVVFDTANHALMLVIVVVMVYPLFHVVAISLSEPSYVDAGMVGWFPRGWNTIGYRYILSQSGIGRYYANTVAYAVAGTFLTLLFTSMVAYSLSSRKFMFKKTLTVYFAITMFFGGGLIPTFLLIRNLGLLNTFAVMVLPSSVSAFNVINFRTFFQSQPYELRESCVIDGANDIRILFSIVLPLSKALLATFALFSIVAHWNSWFPALIYLQDINRHPLQMLLRKLIFQETDMLLTPRLGELSELMRERKLTPRNIQMAIIVVAMVPILVVYPFVQKYFVTGIMIGSIKG